MTDRFWLLPLLLLLLLAAAVVDVGTLPFLLLYLVHQKHIPGKYYIYIYIYQNDSCEIDDFVETHLCKSCVILHYIYALCNVTILGVNKGPDGLHTNAETILSVIYSPLGVGCITIPSKTKTKKRRKRLGTKTKNTITKNSFPERRAIKAQSGKPMHADLQFVPHGALTFSKPHPGASRTPCP